MHGLILAAGEGSRLAADGLTTPKAFVDVAGTPQLLRLVETLEMLRCTSITCMLNESAIAWLRVNSDARLIRAAREIERKATVVPCRTPSSLHTFVAGLERLSAGSVFVSMVDTVMPPNDWPAVYDGACRALTDGAVAALAVTPARDDDDAPLWVGVDPDGRIAALGEPAASGGWVTGGIYAFSTVARDRAAGALASGMHRMRIFLDDLVASGASVRAIEVDRIVDIDHLKDLERANAYMIKFGSTHTVSEQA